MAVSAKNPKHYSCEVKTGKAFNINCRVFIVSFKFIIAEIQFAPFLYNFSGECSFVKSVAISKRD